MEWKIFLHIAQQKFYSLSWVLIYHITSIINHAYNICKWTKNNNDDDEILISKWKNKVLSFDFKPKNIESCIFLHIYHYLFKTYYNEIDDSCRNFSFICIIYTFFKISMESANIFSAIKLRIQLTCSFHLLSTDIVLLLYYIKD